MQGKSTKGSKFVGPPKWRKACGQKSCKKLGRIKKALDKHHARRKALTADGDAEENFGAWRVSRDA